MDNTTYENQEQIRAAYALNMCTVSVSQIVDYNDEYILEQEYEAILNNLNLEQMPKDEALLNILVKLLNVITFFRIDKIKKAQIEKKYQRRMKNAIWSAIPNIGVVVAGDPIAMGISLATQVGIGYMNYRREKANAIADKEDSEIELRITAIEQFNALRRELFTTAWRLADKYNFPDRYRLTERQITQYNRILMDTDEIRKYDRLMAIQDKFEAYLPFWYFIGHSAKYISEDSNNGLAPFEREYYKRQAMRHFDKYDRLNSFNILREDELTASFALEYIDLLLLEEKPDKEKIARLIQTAVNMAGSANDLLELCAVSYLKIGQTEEAEKVLKILVNEDYNTSANARLLSRIYVSEYLKGTNPLAEYSYKILASRVMPAVLFPMPENKFEKPMILDKKLQEQYLSDQQDILWQEYLDVISRFEKKYIVLFNRVIPVSVDGAPDEYFLNSEKALKRRLLDVKNVLESDERVEYIRNIKTIGYRFRYVELLNKMLKALERLRLFREWGKKESMIMSIEENLALKSNTLKKIQENLNQNIFTIENYKEMQFSFRNFTEEFFSTFREHCVVEIMKISSLDELDNIEFDIVQFCQEQGIEEENYYQNRKVVKYGLDEENNYISQSYLGRDANDENIIRDKFKKMLSAVKEAAESMIKDPGKAELLVHGDQQFDLYFKNIKLAAGAFKEKTLAVIDDHSWIDSDLFITCDGVVQVKHNKADTLREFDKITYTGKSIKIGWPDEYTNHSVDLGKLYSLLEELKEIRNEGSAV